MRAFVIFTFLASLAKSGIWITLGVLLKNHFEILTSFVTRKAIDASIIHEERFQPFKKVVEWIGIFIIILGICSALLAFTSLIVGLRVPSHKVNFQF